MPFVKKLKLVQNPCAIVLFHQICVKTLCTTVVLLHIGPCLKGRAQLSYCSTFAPNHTAQLSFCFKWATFLKKAKTCPKHRAQLSCCSKFTSKHSAQLSFCFKLTRIVRKPKPVKNAVNNFPVARNWPQITLCNYRLS